jgi:hypothetical protein
MRFSVLLVQQQLVMSSGSYLLKNFWMNRHISRLIFLKINDRPVTGLCEGSVMAITLSGQQTLDAGHLLYYD